VVDVLQGIAGARYATRANDKAIAALPRQAGFVAVATVTEDIMVLVEKVMVAIPFLAPGVPCSGEGDSLRAAPKFSAAGYSVSASRSPLGTTPLRGGILWSVVPGKRDAPRTDLHGFSR
jgi:hypothetical protein